MLHFKTESFQTRLGDADERERSMDRFVVATSGKTFPATGRQAF